MSLTIHGSQELFGLSFDRQFALSDEGRKRLTAFAFAVASDPDSGVPMSVVEAIGAALAILRAEQQCAALDIFRAEQHRND